VSFREEISRFSSIFIDTAPIIYFIEGDSRFGPLARTAIEAVGHGHLEAYTSVLTLTEVLPKPIQNEAYELATTLMRFLRNGDHFTLIEITPEIAERAGVLRGKNKSLRTVDALHLAAALDVKAGAFLTNDRKVKKIEENLEIVVLADYVQTDCIRDRLRR